MNPLSPIKESLTKIKGFNTLTLYHMAKSPYWYCRCFVNNKVVRHSTKTIDLKEAKERAKKWYLEIQSKVINQEPLTDRTGFELIAYDLLNQTKKRVERKEVAETKLYQDTKRLENDLLPYFGKMSMKDINYKILDSYFSSLNEKDDRNLSSNSFKIHLSHLKQIFKHAQKLDVIKNQPVFPQFKTVDKPRSWFDKKEYSKLHNVIRTHKGEKFKIFSVKGEFLRNGEITEELYQLVIFMMNTFIRPTDIKILQHKHISIMRENDVYLRLSHPYTKQHSNPVVSMPRAVEIYQEILKRQKDEGYGKSDDYVFMPEHKNRAYVIQQFQRMFNHVLSSTNLKKDSFGEDRSLYSIRHTSIMFRLIESENLDILFLARNARTSPEMISRFYAKYLSPEMNIEKIQSQRNSKIIESENEIKDRIKQKK